MDAVRDRALQLIKQIGPKQLSELGGKNHDRWKNISRGAIRISTVEVGVLAEAYPEYALWLISGRVEPENGHRSPDYDEANRNLDDQNAG
jgi:hypothetical protein